MRRVRLTEGQLHRIIRNAVNEAIEDDMSGDENIEQRRDEIVEALKKEGYNASYYDHSEPNKFDVYLDGLTYGLNNDKELKIARYIKDKFNLKEANVWCPGLWFQEYEEQEVDDTPVIECVI